MKSTIAVSVNEITIMELTPDEVAVIVARRERAARDIKRQEYVAELNALIERMAADGYTLGARKGTFKVTGVESWGDNDGKWIALR